MRLLDASIGGRISKIIFVGLVVFMAATAGASPALGADVPDLSNLQGPVWVVPIEGTIDLGLTAFVRRSVEEAIDARASLLLFEVNTFGGRVDAATEIRDALLGSGLPTAAYVTDRAWSAGALIALAADSLWMAPGSSMGAAEPVPSDPKSVSALRAEFEAMAERNDRAAEVAAAMVDANVEIDGLTAKGEILTLSAHRALGLGFAEGVASSRAEVKDALGLAGRREVVASPNWAEQAARFLTSPVMSQLLLTVAFLGLIAEATSPGLGAPGLLGVTALGLFFGGRAVVGLVGLEVILLFVLGIALLLVELLLLPGFGVFGIGGIAAVFASLYYSFASAENAIRSVGTALGVTIVGIALLWRFGKLTGTWGRIILKERQDQKSGYVGPADFSAYLGKTGRALTPLRPAGAVMIDGDRIDAVSDGGFISSGTTVVVSRVDGSRVVVTATDMEEEE